jgi:hypothetical protein
MPQISVFAAVSGKKSEMLSSAPQWRPGEIQWQAPNLVGKTDQIKNLLPRRKTYVNPELYIQLMRILL